MTRPAGRGIVDPPARVRPFENVNGMGLDSFLGWRGVDVADGDLDVHGARGDEGFLFL